MSLILSSAATLLNFIELIIDAVAARVVYIVKKNGNECVYIEYLQNMIYVMVIMNLISSTNDVFHLIHTSVHSIMIISSIRYYLRMFNSILFMSVYLPTKILILIDRILEIKISITYPVVWSVEKAKILLNLLRLLTVVIIVSTLLAYHFAGFNFEFYIRFIIKPLAVCYFIISIYTVVYISYKLNESRLVLFIARIYYAT